MGSQSTFRMLALAALLAAALASAPRLSRAQVPLEIGYQGQVLKNGAPLEGQHLVRVALYEALTGGEPLFEETHTAQFSNGGFNLRIGSVRPFPSTLDFTHGYYLGITVDRGDELTPRTPFTSSPYALTAHLAERAQGLTPDAKGVVTSINEVSGPVWIVGDSLTSVAQTSGKLEIHALPQDMTLQSPEHTVHIDRTGRRSASIDIADNAITEQKLADGAVTSSKMSSSGATTGQVLKWDGHLWTPSEDKNTSYTAGGGISILNNVITATGNPISGTTVNSTLQWSGTSWRENPSLLSDLSGNTQIFGGLAVGTGVGASNIVLNAGSGTISFPSLGQGLLHTDALGIVTARSFNLASDATGVLPVTLGGTGVTSVRNGEVLIGNGTGAFSSASLSGVDGLSIQSSPGSIVLHNSDSTRQWRTQGNTRIAPASQFLGTTDGSPLAMRTNNVERVRIDSIGNIGIGTTLPSQRLEVRNGNLLLSNSGSAGSLIFQSQSNPFQSSFRAGVQTANIQYVLPNVSALPSQVLSVADVSGGTTTLAWQSPTATQWGLLGNSGINPLTNFIGTTDNSNLSFRTNNQEVMTITASSTGAVNIPGNVGIGTSSPRSRLSVAGNIRVGNPVAGTSGTRLDNVEPPMSINGVTEGIVFSGGGSVANTTTADDNSDPIWIARANTAADRSELRVVIGNDAETNVQNDLADIFSVGALSSTSPYTFQPRFSVLGNGTVGIGTTNPHAALEILNGNLLLSRTSNSPSLPQLQLQGTVGKTGFSAGVQNSDIQYVLPTTLGTANQMLSISSISGSTANLTWASPLGGGAWFLNGNVGANSATYFIGTTDTNDFVIRVNNTVAMRYHPTNSIPNLTAGGSGNTISPNAFGSSIAGGGGSGLSSDTVSSNRSFIGGGFAQAIGRTATDAENSAIVGGHSNVVLSSNGYIGGGWSNLIAANSDASAITGGANNAVLSSSLMSGITAGSYDSISGNQSAIAAGQFANINGNNSFIGSGINNRITNDYSSIVGGRFNVASGRSSFIGAGENNRADGTGSAVGAGHANSAVGAFSAIPGGQTLTLAGARSFGYNANNASGGAGMYVTDSGVAVIGNADLWLANTDNTAHQLRLYSAQSGSTLFPSSTTHYTALQSGNSSANITYTLPTTAPAQTGSLLLATSGNTSSWNWSSGLIWDNSAGRLGVNTTSPVHVIHSVNSNTSDEVAAVFGNSTASATSQSIGVWGTASNTNSANTGTIGVLATGNGNTQAAHTNVALQVTDGELAVGRTSELTTNASITESGSAGNAYSGEGPSGLLELTLGPSGNLVTTIPVANVVQDLGMITVVNRYCQSGSIVLISVAGLVEDNQGPKARDAAFSLSVDNTTSGSFGVRIKMIPSQSNSFNYTSSTKIRLGYLIINKSR